MSQGGPGKTCRGASWLPAKGQEVDLHCKDKVYSISVMGKGVMSPPDGVVRADTFQTV